MVTNVHTTDYDAAYAQSLMEEVGKGSASLFRRSIFSAVMVCAAALVLLVTITFSPYDTTADTAGIGQVQNALGSRGAGIANVLMQLFGWGSLLLGGLMFISAVRAVFWPRPARHVWDNIGTFLLYALAFVFGMATLSAFPIPQNWPMGSGLGGWVGDIAFLKLKSGFDLFNIPLSGLFSLLVYFLLAAFCVGRIIGVVGKDLLDIMDAFGLVWATFRVWVDNVAGAVQRRFFKAYGEDGSGEDRFNPAVRDIPDAAPRIGIGQKHIDRRHDT